MLAGEQPSLSDSPWVYGCRVMLAALVGSIRAHHVIKHTRPALPCAIVPPLCHPMCPARPMCHPKCPAHLGVGRGCDGGQLSAGPLPDELVQLLCLLQLALSDGLLGG